MARIIFPEVFVEQKRLFDLTKSKNDADGASSVLIPLLTQRGINLTNDATAMNNAVVHDNNQKQLYLSAEENRQQRDFRVDIIFEGTRGAVQYLKEYYKPNTRTLGQWGISVDGQNRINYPKDFESRVTLMFNMKAKHDSFPGTTSPLRPFLLEHSIDLNLAATALTASRTYHANFLKNRLDAEKETKLRDVLRNPVIEHLHDIGNFLIKLYKGSEEKLGDWGFHIDHSPRAPKLRTSKVEPLRNITVSCIVLGSTFTNIGEVDLHVYKGKAQTSNRYIVHPQGTLPMLRGCSSILVYNPSDSIYGKFTTLRHL